MIWRLQRAPCHGDSTDTERDATFPHFKNISVVATFQGKHKTKSSREGVHSSTKTLCNRCLIVMNYLLVATRTVPRRLHRHRTRRDLAKLKQVKCPLNEFLVSVLVAVTGGPQSSVSRGLIAPSYNSVIARCFRLVLHFP